MKKGMRFLLLFVFAFCLVACQENEKDVDNTKSPVATQKVSDFKVGIVVGKEEAKKSGFVQSAIYGLDNFEKKTGCEVSIKEVESEKGIVEAAKELVKEKCDLIWAVGVIYGEELLKVAKEYPDVNFAVVDGKYEDVPDNVTGVCFRSNEAAFLGGYIAASKSKTGKIAFIGGMTSDVIKGFEVGYKAGAMYYNENIIVETKYSESFTDAQLVKGIAKELYDGGCDVLFAASGAAGVGAIEEAVAQGKYIVGVDVDQSSLGEDVVITSVLKMVDSAVEYVCLRAKEGIDVGGQNMDYGLSDGAVGIPPYSPDFIPLSEQNKIDNLKEMIVSDRLVVPETQKELEEFKPVRE